jgi:hypothetical protein
VTRLLVESELELLISVSLLLLPPVELESKLELESLDVFDDTPTFGSTLIGNTPTFGSSQIGNSDPSTARIEPPSVSGDSSCSSVIVDTDDSLGSSTAFFLSSSSKSVTDLIASIFSIISILESLPPSDQSAIFLATGAGDSMY